MQPLSFPINAAQDQVFAQRLLAAQLPHRSRAFKIVPRRWMGGGGPAGHAIAVNVFRLTWWLPFFSLALFRPRILVVAKNGGETLPGWALVLYVAKYDGRLASLSQHADGWQEATRITHLEPWPKDAVREESIKLASTTLATPGTYVFRLRVVRNDPTPSGLWGSNEILEHDIAEYFRVEPMSSVLTFGLVVGTILTALGRLALALR